MKNRLTITKEDLENNKGGGGLEIRIPEFEGDPESPDAGQIFIEYYKGKIRVHVWKGYSEPTTTELEPQGGIVNNIITLGELRKLINEVPKDRDCELVSIYDLNSGDRFDIVNMDTDVKDTIDFNFDSSL